MSNAIKDNQERVTRRFGNEQDVQRLTSISRRTLQKDRLLGRARFPWYKSGRRVLYDLLEVEATIRTTRIDAGGAA
jgi:hypothetical protein